MAVDINETLDEFFETLSEYSDEAAQRKAIEAAKNLKPEYLSLLMAPYPKCGVNCAKVLSELSDEVLRSHSTTLLEWISDMNYPGAEIILDRLKRFKDVSWLAVNIDRGVKEALLFDEQIWLCNIAELLDNERLKPELPSDVYNVLYCRYKVNC